MAMRTRRPHAIDISTTRFTRQIRSLIWFGTFILPGSFAWIEFRDFPFDIFLASSTTPMLLWHVALSLYYLSWIAGSNFDVNVQELVYAEFQRGRVPLHGVLTVLVLIGAGALLLWTERNIQRFAIAIDIFIVVDHLAWRYLIWLIKPVVRNSQNTYIRKRDYFALEALNIVSYQIQGNWKWWRFTGTIPIVIAINAFAFFGKIHSYLTITTISVLPILSTVDASQCLSGAFILCFVLVAEIWSWAIRIRTLVSLKRIDDIYVKYVLLPVEDLRTRLNVVRSDDVRRLIH